MERVPSTEVETEGELPDGVLSDITHLLVNERSPERVLHAVADGLQRWVPHDSLILFQADVSLHLLRPALVRDPLYEEEIIAEGARPYDEGLTGVAVVTSTPILANDAHLDPRVYHIPGTPFEPESLIALPLMASGELKGALCVARIGEANHFTDDEFQLAIRFGELAALAIDNAQIRARLESEVVTDHLTGLFNHRYFHERLAEEVRRSNRTRSSVGLLIYDIDDFKRVNDTHGHLVGDEVLQAVASISREISRLEDVICRIGGEEFGVILPGCSLEETIGVAERLREGIAAGSLNGVGRVAISVGVAVGPLHASSPRELIACADLALLEAKAAGKDRVWVSGQHEPAEGPPRNEMYGRAGISSDPFTEEIGLLGRTSRNGHPNGDGNGHATGVGARLTELAARGKDRVGAEMQMLHKLASRLNRLHDVGEIADVVTAELRSLIDYHNCRVHLLQPDGETLLPIAFRGSLSEPHAQRAEPLGSLTAKVGEGLTGRVALTGEALYTPNAIQCEYAVTIPGTGDVEESILGVPLKHGNEVIGTILLSKLGIDQFDDQDKRLLEVLASNAGVAFENARLYQAARESAETSATLLAFSQAMTRVRDVGDVLDEALSATAAILDYPTVGAWIRDPETGSLRLARHKGFDPSMVERSRGRDMPPDVTERFLLSIERPFVLTRDVISTVPREYALTDEVREVMVAPMRWEPDGLAAFLVISPDEATSFSQRDLNLVRGIADITSLALGNAGRFVELERAYVSTVEALANALEAKDAYTEDHCRALAEMAMAVGADLGLGGERLKLLELGALFHDIGKIGIPSDILRKPGPLTAAERREMNRHTLIGERILSPVPFLQPIRPIVRSSHERWDGNGYPDGLHGEAIPVESRIVFVCDAFHAMVTDRPYRSALPHKEAIRRLRLSSGTQFDPEVVERFVTLQKGGAIKFH